MIFIGGCKCPGFELKIQPQTAVHTPPVCSHCEHAKSMHK